MEKGTVAFATYERCMKQGRFFLAARIARDHNLDPAHTARAACMALDKAERNQDAYTSFAVLDEFAPIILPPDDVLPALQEIGAIPEDLPSYLFMKPIPGVQ